MSARVRVVAQTESKESVNGSRRSAYRQVVGVEDEAKREVLSSCMVAWCKGSLRGENLAVELDQAGLVINSMMRVAGAVFLMRFTDEEDHGQVLGRPDLDRWFVKVEAWKSDLRIDSQSAWFSVVGLPMHLWSEESFQHIASLWGKLIRIENATLEPRSFERAGILIETEQLEKVEETIELVGGSWSGRIRVQEVEVVHSHDLLCEYDDAGTVISCEADKDGGEMLRVVRDNPVLCRRWRF
ncbi:hypothetical protein V6N13_074019 [Hibiscus sabdariffa]